MYIFLNNGKGKYDDIIHALKASTIRVFDLRHFCTYAI